MIETRINKGFKFLLIMLILVVTLTITSCKKEVSSYSDIERIVHKEILNQKGNKNNTYYVIIYSTTCTFCENLEDSVVARDFPGMADVDSSYLLFFKNVKIFKSVM